MTTRRRIDPLIQQAIGDLVLSRDPQGRQFIPAQIHRKIVQLWEDGEFGDLRAPSVKTVERIVKDLRPDDESGWWNLGDSKGDDAKLVFYACFGEFLHSALVLGRITKAEAGWLVKILKAVPDLPREIVWRVSSLYRISVALNLDTADLDQYLTFAPWRSQLNYQLYRRVVDVGDVRPVRSWGNLVEEHDPSLSPEEKAAMAAERWRERGEWVKAMVEQYPQIQIDIDQLRL